jgi:hypothetical protein
MSLEINQNMIFRNIMDNINNEDVINTYIDMISDNFFNIDYIYILTNIINSLDDINFIILFLNKLFDNLSIKYNEMCKFMLIDIIKNINKTDNLKFKNLFILNIVDYTMIYEIIKIHDISIEDLIDIYSFIYEIGKINIIDELLDNIIIDNKSLTYPVLFRTLLSLLQFQKKLIYTDFYVDITSKLATLMYILLPIFELKEFVQNLLFDGLDITHNNEHLIIIFDFFRIVINNHNKYFNICVVDNIFELLNLLIKLNIKTDTYINILDDVCKLLLTDIINIHEKTKIFINIAKIIIKTDYNLQDLITYIDYFVTNIKFLSWSTLDEKILIIEYISKLLLKLNNMFYFDNYDNMLYNILYLEIETFNILKIILNTHITYSDYNLIKNTAYNIITSLNIFNDVQFTYFDFCKENNKYYADLLHKNNLIINTYLLYFTDTSKNIYKFNINLIFSTIIINKFMIIYKHIGYELFPLNSIEYEILEKYYIDNKINIFNDFLIKINVLKNKSIISDDFITICKDEFIDNIFSIEIIDPIMIPHSNDFFEKSTMYLLIRETQKNPYTREELTIQNIIEYNMRDDIKNKINDFLIKKNNLV